MANMHGVEMMHTWLKGRNQFVYLSGLIISSLATVKGLELRRGEREGERGRGNVTDVIL